MATGSEQQRPPVCPGARRRPPTGVFAVLMAALIAVLVDPAGRAAASSDAGQPSGFFAVVAPATIAELISEMSGIEAVSNGPAHGPQTPEHQEPLVFTIHQSSERHFHLISVEQGSGGALFQQAARNGGTAADSESAADASVFARLQDLPASAGPGGSTFGLVFTTCDGRFDVRIIASENLPQDFGGQSVDIHVLARRLAANYSANSC